MIECRLCGKPFHRVNSPMDICGKVTDTRVVVCFTKITENQATELGYDTHVQAAFHRDCLLNIGGTLAMIAAL